jgi:hypothetical protein
MKEAIEAGACAAAGMHRSISLELLELFFFFLRVAWMQQKKLGLVDEKAHLTLAAPVCGAALVSSERYNSLYPASRRARHWRAR